MPTPMLMSVLGGRFFFVVQEGGREGGSERGRESVYVHIRLVCNGCVFRLLHLGRH